MMKNRVAIIDLGTNTCNLLIAEYEEEKFKILYQGKEVVKLGKGGIDKNTITEDGLDRAVLSLKKHLERIEKFMPLEIEVFATSAVRDALNQDWFQSEVERKTNLKLQIISGEKEADLIFKGVRLAFNRVVDHSLILDIGGGSNEFILSKKGIPAWKESFPLGMARIIELIPPSDPITKSEIQQIVNYFSSRLDSLWNITQGIQISGLIGCSGAFDTLADLIDQTEPGTKTRIRQKINCADFERLYEMLIKSTAEERIRMKGMESIRIEMIIPSVIFIKLVIDRLKIQNIYQTDFALREGVLFQHIFE